ncbi:MAG: Protein GrpE [Candidatus Daviesbacteria bacterium GW2011_GWA2_38_24]|uniref:Protein GrpE n=1 Tax=Candidatus Daviesbacteria bacterium GW2011_GWA2_38_24 TaxID=1618422 RepID=A0A0G0JWG9_9BACT|nr:MAG: Protein GrpE [Candidatus Daviesbacteria bacterium GW2011_GWA2_38_24]KKQ79571.1 MAG: Protein GrpE [Candidatus Daviesbacteria bacterium GW2011_GWA1_38_7]OGE22825.1 MAG: nucleotide exchange factor GrpE [Candidatus Daviesbacteria bacterium RIFCSPHIGHO2_01_FULL_38_8]
MDDKKQKSQRDDIVEPKEERQTDSSSGEIQAVRKELEDLRAEFERVESQFKRAVADYHNLEKRVTEGRAELAKWATGQLIEKLLPMLDIFEKATKGATDEERKSGWFKGVEMGVASFKAVLKEEGLEEIKGDGKFDPNLHEAIDLRVGEEGKVLEVIEKGYTLNGKVLKPAKVIVGKKG